MNYIRLLNRILYSADGRTVFVPKDAKGGSLGKMISTLKKEQKQNRAMTFWLFLDEDIYYRDQNLKLNLQQKSGNAIINFSRMNFEDVIMLHEPPETLMKWVQLCKQLQHFNSPLTENDYLLHFRKFYPDYHKRELPFELTNNRLTQAFANLKYQTEIQSSLLSSIELLLQRNEIVWRYA